MPYADLNTIHNPATGTQAPASWGDQVRDNFENGEYTIARTVLGVAASSISSGTLPTLSNGWCLRIVVTAQNSAAPSINVGLRFNSDSGSNYTRQFLYGNDTVVAADAEAATTSLLIGTMGNESSNRFSTIEAIVPEYLSTSRHKTVQSLAFDPRNLSGALIVAIGGVWASTSAITSVSVHAASNNFVAGSTLTVMARNYV